MKEVLDIAKLAVLIVSPFAVVAIAWAIILRFVSKKKPKSLVITIPKISPAYIARRVMYATELEHIVAAKGDLAYVLKENRTYFYNGEEWLKVEEKHGAVGN